MALQASDRLVGLGFGGLLLDRDQRVVRADLAHAVAVRILDGVGTRRPPRHGLGEPVGWKVGQVVGCGDEQEQIIGLS